MLEAKTTMPEETTEIYRIAVSKYITWLFKDSFVELCSVKFTTSIIDMSLQLRDSRDVKERYDQYNSVGVYKKMLRETNKFKPKTEPTKNFQATELISCNDEALRMVKERQKRKNGRAVT